MKYIKIAGDIYKEKDKDFTNKEKDEFIDEFVKFVEERGLLFIGITT